MDPIARPHRRASARSLRLWSDASEFASPSSKDVSGKSAYRDYLGSLQDQLLLWMRDGSWRGVAQAVGWLAPRMKPDLSVERYLAAGGVRDTKLEHQFGEGKRLVAEDVLDSLRCLKLAAFREGPNGEELCATPLVDPRFDIDPEFEHAIPSAPEIVKQLEERLLVGEARESLTVWKSRRTLVDGYRAFRLFALLGRSYSVMEVEFADRDAALAWLYDAHYPRGYPDEMNSFMRGIQYANTKKQHGGARRKKGTRSANTRTAKILAMRYGVSEGTILADAAFAAGLLRVAMLAGDDVRRQVLSRELTWTKIDVQELAKLSDGEIKDAVRVARETGTRPDLSTRKARSVISPAFRKLEHAEKLTELARSLGQEALREFFVYWTAAVRLEKVTHEPPE